MNKELQKIIEERDKLVKELQSLDVKRSEIMTRIYELQGVIKYLQEKENKDK